MRTVEVLEKLLACAVERISCYPTCRSFVHPGQDAVHDVCSMSDGHDGQLWVAHLGTQPGWPSPTGLPTNCATAWNDVIEVGIVRCARGKVTDQGTAPHPNLVTEDAMIQERDRILLRQAILCCLPIESRDMLIQDWEPIPPSGGCVGGVWTFYSRDDGCDCDSTEL